MNNTGHISDFTTAQLLYQQAADDSANLAELITELESDLAFCAEISTVGDGTDLTEIMNRFPLKPVSYSGILPSGVVFSYQRVYAHPNASKHWQSILKVGDKQTIIMHVEQQYYNAPWKRVIACGTNPQLLSLSELKGLTSSSEVASILEETFSQGFTMSSIVDQIKDMFGKSEFIQATCQAFLTNAGATLSEVISHLQAAGGVATSYLAKAGAVFSGVLAAGGNVLEAILAIKQDYINASDTSTDDDYLANWDATSHQVKDSPVIVIGQILSTVGQLIGGVLLASGGVIGKVIGGIAFGISALVSALQNVTGVTPTIDLSAPDSRYCDPIFDGAVTLQNADIANTVAHYLVSHGSMVLFHPFYSIYLWDVTWRYPYQACTCRARIYPRSGQFGCIHDADWRPQGDYPPSYHLPGGEVHTLRYLSVNRLVDGVYEHICFAITELAGSTGFKLYSFRTSELVSPHGEYVREATDGTFSVVDGANYQVRTGEDLLHDPTFCESQRYYYDGHQAECLGNISEYSAEARELQSGLKRSLRYIYRYYLLSTHKLSSGSYGYTTLHNIALRVQLGPWSELTTAFSTSESYPESFINLMTADVATLMVESAWSLSSAGFVAYVPGIAKQYTTRCALIPPERSVASVVLAAVIVVAVVAAIAITAMALKKSIQRRMYARSAISRSALSQQWEAAVASGDRSELVRLQKVNNKYNLLYSMFGVGPYDLANGWTDSADSTGATASVLGSVMDQTQSLAETASTSSSGNSLVLADLEKSIDDMSLALYGTKH